MDLCRMLVEGSPGLYVALGRQGEILAQNGGFEGLPRGPPAAGDDSTASQERILRAGRWALDTGCTHSFELRLPSEGAPDRWYECTVTPIRSVRGEVVATAAIGLEVTEQKQEEERLRRREALLMDAQGIAHLGIWTYELGQPTVHWTPELYEIYGVTPATFQPTFEGFLARVHEDDRERVRRELLRVVEERVPFGHDERILRPDGSVRCLHTWGHPIQDERGRVVQLIGVCQDVTDIRQNERDLQELLSLQSATLEATADGILVTDSEQRIVAFNQRLLDIWKIPRSVVEGRHYTDSLQLVLPHLAEPEACQSQLTEIFAHPDEDSFDVLRFKSGTVLERYSRPQRLNGKTIGRVFSYRDVTSHAHAEAVLRQNEIRQRAVLDSALDGIIWMTSDGKISEFNKAAEALFRCRAVDVIGRELAEVIIPERLRARHRQGLKKFLATGEGPFVGRRIEAPALRADGTEFPAELSIIAVQSAAGLVFTGFIRDMSELKRYQERLQVLADASRTLAEARLELRPVFQVTARIIAEALREGCIVRLFSKDRTQLETVAYHHVEPELEQLMERMLPHAAKFIDQQSTETLLRTGKAVVVSVSLDQARQRIRKEFWPILERYPFHSWIMVPLRVGGEIIGTMTAMRYRPGGGYTDEDAQFLSDLADRAALAIDNARLFGEAQDAVRSRDQFLMMASHEFRTPLTPLKLQLQLLSRALRSGPGSAHVHRLIGNSDRSLARLNRLVDDMLDVSKMNAGEQPLTLGHVDPAELVQEVVGQLESELQAANCPVELSVEKGLVGNWDRGRLNRALTHVLTNAMKFGHGKPIQIGVSRANGKARLVIRDFGIGIALDDQRRIFAPFERAVPTMQFSGLGLGLAITQQIVEAHGGTISVESRPLEGAAFTVELPLVPK
jgi:PAS domain S-box-containing protein